MSSLDALDELPNSLKFTVKLEGSRVNTFFRATSPIIAVVYNVINTRMQELCPKECWAYLLGPLQETLAEQSPSG